MEVIKGFPSTSQDNYQLNVTNIIKHGARIFERQEIVSRKHDGSMFRYTYQDAYLRIQRLANALSRLGLKVGDRVGIMAWNTHENYEMRDCFFQVVPMFHVLGWGSAHAATMVGAKYVLSGMYSLDRLGELGEILVREKVTVSNGAPALLMPMLEFIRNMDEKPDLTGARLACGATEPPVTMMKDYWDMTGAEIVHSYGATETTPMVTINRIKPWLEKELPEDEKWDLRRKQGYAVVGLDLKVVGTDGTELPHDGRSAGEILIRGPWVTASYYNSPGSEAQFTDDGYWKSGDAGTIDAEGYLKITDHVKDVIKSGGEWISSVDMENEVAVSIRPLHRSLLR